MYFDRFDIVEAHYIFCTDYHDGQWSNLYAKLCRIGGYFSPGAAWSGRIEDTSENCQEIYARLVENHGA